MIVSRRSFLVGCAGLPAISAIAAAPLTGLQPASRGCVSEVWGLPFWAQGAAPAAVSRKKLRSAPPTWNFEFC